MPSWIHKTTISDDLLKEIYASDQDMYPAPLPYERLKGWIEASPDLSICFEATPEEGGDPVPVGAVIVFPLLKKYWDEILVGKLKEPNIDSATMFPSDAEAEVGLHVFHVERFDSTNPSGRLRRFAEFALEDTREIVRRKGWKIVGYSGISNSTAASRATSAYFLTLLYSSHGHTDWPSGMQADGLQGYRIRGDLCELRRGWRCDSAY